MLYWVSGELGRLFSRTPMRNWDVCALKASDKLGSLCFVLYWLSGQLGRLFSGTPMQNWDVCALEGQ